MKKVTVSLQFLSQAHRTVLVFLVNNTHPYGSGQEFHLLHSRAFLWAAKHKAAENLQNDAVRLPV